MKNMYFETDILKPGVTQIRDEVGDCMYLVEGEDRAALIDTGTGYGYLADFVKTLTDLPITVLLTHGHLDHAGGIYDFEKVYVHPGDIALIEKHTTYENRADYIKSIKPDLYERLPGEAYCAQKRIAFYSLYEGEYIDLGNQKLEVIEVPGHTAGSVCFLDRKNRLAFTGDACCMRTLFFKGINSIPLKSYLKSLLKFLQFLPEVDKMYWGHYDGLLTEECVFHVLEDCVNIINGEDEKVPFTFMGEQGFSAHVLESDNLNRKDGKIGNIVYGADLV